MGKKSSGFASNVLKLTGGNIVAIGITVLVTPVLTRLYSPEAFGLAALFASITGIIGVVACLRYELAILLPKDDGDAANVLGVSLIAVALMVGVSGLLVVLCRGPILRALEAEELASYIWLIPVAVLFGGVFLALNYWNLRTKLFGRLAIARTAQSAATNGSQLVLGLIGLACVGSLIWSAVVGAAIVALILAVLIWRDEGKLFRTSMRLGKTLECVKRYRKFPLIDFWGSLLGAASQGLPVLILGVYFAEGVVGQYAIARRVIYLPMTLIGAAIGRVFFQRAAEAHSKGEDLTAVVEKVFRRLVMLALLPSLLAILTGREWFVLIFGSNWAEAGVFVQILGVWMFFWFVSSPLTVLFAVFERLELAFIVHVVLFVARVVPLVIGGVLGNVYLALSLFAGSGVLVYGGLAIWCMALVGVSIFSQLRMVCQEAFHAIPVAGVVLLLKIGLKAPTWLVLTASAVGLLAYGALLFRRDPELSSYLRTLMRRSGSH